MPRELPEISPPTIASTLSHHSIPLSKYKEQNPQYTNLATGGFILRTSPTTKTSQVLLLKRASGDSYPNMWEPPGGSVDDEDSTLLHGLVRELWEESGLKVTKVVRQIWDKDGKGEEEVAFSGKRGDHWCKLNFLVEVEGNEDGSVNVELDRDEHQAWGWFEKEEMEKLEFVSLQAREIVRNAFTAFEEGLKV